MPFYYQFASTEVAITTTEVSRARLLTVADQQSCRVTALWGDWHSAVTAGACRVRLVTCSTPGTAGTQVTPDKCNPKSPAAETTAFSLPTAGTGVSLRATVGGSRLGGGFGWSSLGQDSSINLAPNGGADGNLELRNIGTAAVQGMDFVLEFCEGDDEA